MSRGQLPGLLEAAAAIAEQRLSGLIQALDDMAEVAHQAPFGGRALAKRDHLLLLANDEAYQEAVLAKAQFGNEDDQAALKRDLEKVQALYPEKVPATNATIPQMPWEAGPPP